MRCKYFANKKRMLIEAVHAAIQYEESFIDAYMSSGGIWGDKNRLDKDAKEAVERSEKAIVDWKKFLEEEKEV